MASTDNPRLYSPVISCGRTLNNGDVGRILPALADEAVDIGQGAGQVIGQAFVGRLADFARGKDGIGQDPVLEPFLHIGDGPLEQEVDHPDERQLGGAGLDGGGQEIEAGRRRRGIRAEIAGDRLLVAELPGDDVRELVELYDGGLIMHSRTPTKESIKRIMEVSKIP